jgi:hypothetical protein
MDAGIQPEAIDHFQFISNALSNNYGIQRTVTDFLMILFRLIFLGFETGSAPSP